MTSPALAAALRKIDLTFGRPNGMALRYAKQALALGASHPMPRARYAALVTMAADGDWDLDTSIRNADGLLGGLRRRLATGMGRGITPLDVEITKEARLCLRWLRRHCPTAYGPALDILTVPVGHRAPTLVVVSAPIRDNAPARAADLVAAAG